MKKKRKLKIIPILTTILIILAIILIIILSTHKKSTTNKNLLIGSWTTDNITIYKFNENNTGSLKLPLSEYKFTYKTKDNKLMIDFENEKSEDSTYTYTLKDNKLILKNSNGTFKFKKKNK